MAVILLPDQIPQMWEAIKYAAVNADQVEEGHRDRYLNVLLYQLLSSKAQCFVRLDSARRLQALAVTSVVVDEMRDEKSLYVKFLYSFAKVDDEVWKQDIEVLKLYAIKNECKSITAKTHNDKAFELVKMLGMKERHKSLIMEV